MVAGSAEVKVRRSPQKRLSRGGKSVDFVGATPCGCPRILIFTLCLTGSGNPSVSKADRGVQGGRVRRSRTFSVPQARKTQNRRFCRRRPACGRDFPEATTLPVTYNQQTTRRGTLPLRVKILILRIGTSRPQCAHASFCRYIPT